MNVMFSLCILLLTTGISLGVNPLEVPVKTIDGKKSSLAAGKPKAVLIVNTASRCGYTRQYADLESLYQKYKAKGLVVAGFPCNQFGGQEPGNNEEIASFCSKQFAVTFPMFAKIEVNGDGRHPLYQALAGEDSPFPGEIGWNFTKFLVNSDGKIVARFASGVNPTSDQLIEAIEKCLGQ